MINFNDLFLGGISNVNFVVVKIGDVSGDVMFNSFVVIDECSYEGFFVL